MSALPKGAPSRERAAALIIVLAFVVILTGLVLAYFSRATSNRPVAHSSFNQSRTDLLVASAMDSIIGDLRQEMIDGSTATPVNGITTYTPTSAANMIPQRSGNPTGVPNLIRRSVRLDPILAPGRSSRASAVNSTTDASANGRSITSTRWNSHYLVPKRDTTTNDSVPVDVFSSATPDWVFVEAFDPATQQGGATIITSPSPLVIGRYAYAIYDEGGLLDMNVAGYPKGTTPAQSGRKGSIAFADLSALPFPITNSSSPYQIDRLVGWRNYATTQPANNFPDVSPPSKVFANNFQTDATPATNFYNYVVNNTTGFLTTSGTTWTPTSNALRTDQAFVNRQELIAFRSTLNTNNGNPIPNTSQFDANALQYLGTFSRETNSPSFSPSTPAGSTIAYASLANSGTAINPNFLLARVTTSFTRFDGSTAALGEPLVKTRFPLSRLAWITYKGPSASRNFPPQLPALLPTDPDYDMWSLLWTYGVPQTFLPSGTVPNIQACFGLTFLVGGTAGDPWTYSHGATDRILRLDEVAAAGREPDFFELLQAAILSGSLGQNTGGGVSGGPVFPDIHMSNTTHHILSIGAAIIDQADPDSIPTRIQFNPSGTVWTAYGVESLPYITQLYPIAGASPDDPTKWATYLLFHLWNPLQTAPSSRPPVRLRVDGGIGIFTGGNGETWNTGSNDLTVANGQSITLKPSVSFSTPTPLTTDNSTATAPAVAKTFGVLYAPAVPTPTP